MAREVRLTPDGYQRLQDELDQAQQRRAEVIRSMQDLTDSALDLEDTSLQSAQNDARVVEARIVELEDTLARAIIVDNHDTGNQKVSLGAVVVLSDENDREMRVQLVSAPEASILSDGDITKVSEDSPVGSELRGRQTGDSFRVQLGDRKAEYRVKRIEHA